LVHAYSALAFTVRGVSSEMDPAGLDVEITHQILHRGVHTDRLAGLGMVAHPVTGLSTKRPAAPESSSGVRFGNGHPAERPKDSFAA
jgi:hypothetical protein